MIRRRSFLKGCAGVAGTPVLGCLAPAVARDLPAAAREVAPGFSPPAVHSAGPETALRIHGWDAGGDPGDAWVQIGPRWRAAWR